MFNNKTVVGISVTPEIGFEVAQIDFQARIVNKYACKPLEYNINTRSIADLDLFKETLQDLLLELEIPRNATLVINIPTVEFKINDYSASIDQMQLDCMIEEEVAESPFFKEEEACISAVLLPGSTLQSHKIAYTAAQKNMLLEIVMIVESLGYKVGAIDTSISSLLNALIYRGSVNIVAEQTWLLLIVENYCCRILSMNGNNFVDIFEESISIAEVLGDAENYSTVISAVSPILKNIPAQYLCVVSKTNAISAEVLSGKLTYSSPIIYQDINRYTSEAFMEVSHAVDASLAPKISLDVIGAAIYYGFKQYASVSFNLYNKSLGSIYTDAQPPEFNISGKTIVISNALLVKLFIILALIIIVPTIFGYLYFMQNIRTLQEQQSELNMEIGKIEQFLKDNENISSELFDEGSEVRSGIDINKRIYTYYTIVGTEIPKKLWLTHLKLSDTVVIEGQADNLESIYSFFRRIKDYDPSSNVKLQKMGLATKQKHTLTNDKEVFDAESILTTLNADFYEFRISDDASTAENFSKLQPSTNNSSGDSSDGGNLELPENLEPAN